MEYSVGSVGRVVVVRLSEGDELYECIEGVAVKEGIASAAVFITGGIRKADVVVGPKEEKPKIVGDFRKFVGPGEVRGVGNRLPCRCLVACQPPSPRTRGAWGRGQAARPRLSATRRAVRGTGGTPARS